MVKPVGPFTYPLRMNAASLLLDDNVEKRGEAVAIFCGDERITYSELQERVNRFGNALRELGIGRGDRVLCRLPNIPEAAVAFLAALKIGAVPISSFPFLREQETAHVIGHSGAVAVVTTPKAVKEVDDVRQRHPFLKHVITVGGAGDNHLAYEELSKRASGRLEAEEMAREDLGYLCYSSGTTSGIPKGLPHAHETLICQADMTYPFVAPVGPGDILFTPAPFGFAFGLAFLVLNPLRFGASVVYVPERLPPEGILQTIQKYRVTLMATASPLLHRILDLERPERSYDLSTLRFVQTGASPVSRTLFDTWVRRLGIDLAPGYGLQETVGPVCHCPLGEGRPESLGRLVPGREARVLDANHEEVPPSRPGVLWIKGKSIIPYYWKDPERTARSFKDGWFATADVVFQDADGYYHYVGRADDIIKSSGWTISPDEVEHVLAGHPAVMEVAVVGVPHAVRGQALVAAVVLRAGWSPSADLEGELKDLAKRKLSSFKCPQQVRFVEALPKTSTEKVMRSRVREQWESPIF